MVRHHVRVGPLLWRFRRPRAGGDPAAFVEKSMDPCLCRDDGMAGVVQLLQWPDQCHSVILNSIIGAPFQPFVADKPRRCLCFVFGISQNLKILSPRRRPGRQGCLDVPSCLEVTRRATFAMSNRESHRDLSQCARIDGLQIAKGFVESPQFGIRPRRHPSELPSREPSITP